MNWYVKYEGTGKVSGPMNREEALAKAERADGMVFHDGVFEERGDNLSVSYPLLDGVKDVIIQLLSREALSESERKQILVLVARLCRSREIRAMIRGGVFDVVSIDDGIHLVVNDYDVEGSSPDVLDQDDEGNDCVISEYGG